MVQIVLEGDTLGARHKHYNKLLNDTVGKGASTKPEKLSSDDNDLDNLFKIDIACSNRDVEYLLEVLKSEDLLYVSRVLKRSAWLITDPAHAHLINPVYLHTHLFPYMTAKAISNMIQHIRLNLKDETRAEEFYNYYKTNNKKTAFKWLLNCSVSFIEKELPNFEARDIDIMKIFPRLCRKSISILEIYLKTWPYNSTWIVVKKALFLLNTDPEKYLDIIEKREHYEMPNFNSKFTDLIMKKCPNRITDKFEKYCFNIHLPTFAKYLKKSDIEDFLLKYYKKEEMRSWFRHENLKHFIRYMPKEGRFEFLKSFFIDKTHKVFEAKDALMCADTQVCAMKYSRCNIPNNSSNIYRWYRYAMFEIAFTELKKMIRNESNPSERVAILDVLISCAGKNKQHILTLLEYYQEKHINEPFKFKIQFVNNIISRTKTHEFDDKTWAILNNLFHSLEVYSESENNVQNCVQAIVIYKVLHYETVPEILHKKFVFNTMKAEQKKLNDSEVNKVFVFLHNYLMTKLKGKSIQTEAEFVESIQLLESVIDLFTDYKKELTEFPWVLNYIKKLLKLKEDNSWKADLSSLYNKNKRWRQCMFELSICLSPNEKVCINALKHDPNLLDQNKNGVDALCRNDRVSLSQFLSKIRIYWPESMATEWSERYRSRLDAPGGYDAFVRGICALLPRKEVARIAEEYAPTENKINWSEDDEKQLGLRKYLAKNIYRSRPQPPMDVVLLYARGDYLQFALPSLNSVLYNISAQDSRNLIKTFLNTPVSLQKHAIRLAFSKLEPKELKQILSDIWKTTKNASIRAVLFNQTFELLCKEKNPGMIVDIWQLMSMFIDNLSQEEDKNIYITLGKTAKVPAAVRGQYCMRSYKYLNSLPAKANCEGIVKQVVNSMANMMEYLDSGFVADILLSFLETQLPSEKSSYNYILSPYLLCCKDIKSQSEKYERVVVPYLDVYLKNWNKKGSKDKDNYFFRSTLRDFLQQLWADVKDVVFVKDMIFPVKVFKDILSKIEQLPLPYNYVMLRHWKLVVAYVELLEGQTPVIKSIREKNNLSDPEHNSNIDMFKIWNEVFLNVSQEISNVCLEILKEDINAHFPSIYLLFAEAFRDVHSRVDGNDAVFMETLKNMLTDKDFTEGYLMVITAMPEYLSDDLSKIEKEIRKLMSSSTVEVKMHYYYKFKFDMCDK